MNSNMKLTVGQKVDRFEVDEFLNDNRCFDSYLAHDESGMSVLMQLYDEDELERLGYDLYENNDGALFAHYSIFLPILYTNRVEVEDREYTYMVRQYINGESVADSLNRGALFSWDEAVKVLGTIVDAMIELRRGRDVQHNNITCKNILLQGAVGELRVFLVGTNYMSRSIYGRPTFDVTALDPWYRAPETYVGMYGEVSDIFSMGVVLFTMLSGKEPWGGEIPANATAMKVRGIVNKTRRQTKLGELIKGLHLDVNQERILTKMLAMHSCDRIKSFEALKSAFETGMIPIAKIEENSMNEKIERPAMRRRHNMRNLVQESMMERQKAEENGMSDAKGGFDDVAGLDEVKQILRDEVMFVMQNKDMMKEYRVKAPNGMLLYGPPGCGKTFIAEKFAQESKMNFVMIHGSDLGGTFIHETQGNIARLFKNAEEKAPVILCFDEVDSLMSNRQNLKEMYHEEVNEFLCQLNNCGEKGIFVIGTTNCPDSIDKAVLRTGRLDKMVYIPAPDKEARKLLIEIEMRGRKSEGEFDYDALAEAAKDCVSSDISCIVNEVALSAALKRVPISQQMLLEKLKTGRRSVQAADLQRYEELHREMIHNQGLRGRIGFMANR